jgi:hypothetical protein
MAKSSGRFDKGCSFPPRGGSLGRSSGRVWTSLMIGGLSLSSPVPAFRGKAHRRVSTRKPSSIPFFQNQTRSNSTTHRKHPRHENKSLVLDRGRRSSRRGTRASRQHLLHGRRQHREKPSPLRDRQSSPLQAVLPAGRSRTVVVSTWSHRLESEKAICRIRCSARHLYP